MRRIRLFVMLLIVFFCPFLSQTFAASPSLTEQFQTLKDTVLSFDLPSEVENNLLDLVGIAEVHAADGVTNFTATEALLDSFLFQIVALMFMEQSGANTVIEEDGGEEPIDILVGTVDSIKATLFFSAPALLIHAPSMETVPEGSCSVRILTRINGLSLYDPGGMLYSRFADTVELAAEAQPAGGSFAWSMEPAGDTVFRSEATRFSFRGVDPYTFRITVRYSGSAGEACEDVLWVRVQGDFPDLG